MLLDFLPGCNDVLWSISCNDTVLWSCWGGGGAYHVIAALKKNLKTNLSRFLCSILHILKEE